MLPVLTEEKSTLLSLLISNFAIFLLNFLHYCDTAFARPIMSALVGPSLYSGLCKCDIFSLLGDSLHVLRCDMPHSPLWFHLSLVARLSLHQSPFTIHKHCASLWLRRYKMKPVKQSHCLGSSILQVSIYRCCHKWQCAGYVTIVTGGTKR